jgi:MFS family permease
LLVVEVSLAVYNSLFFIGYHVDFSQVEDNNHAGKQISTMSIFIRAAATLGPFIGGLVAGRWGFRATLGLAVLLLAVAAWPLLRTREQTHTRKQLRLARFDFRRDWRNNLVYVGEAISRQGTLVFWPLYLSVFVFVTNTYGMIGFVSTVSIGASLLTMRYFGKLVDDNKGGLLLAGSSVATAVTNSMRIFATNFGSVVFLNLSTELAESGQMLGMSRGFYGEADESNDRVGYVTTVEIVICLARSFQWLAMFFLVVLVGAKLAFALMFVTAGLGSLLINLQRFKSLKSHPFGIKLGQSE